MTGAHKYSNSMSSLMFLFILSQPELRLRPQTNQFFLTPPRHFNFFSMFGFLDPIASPSTYPCHSKFQIEDSIAHLRALRACFITTVSALLCSLIKFPCFSCFSGLLSMQLVLVLPKNHPILPFLVFLPKLAAGRSPQIR